MRDVLTFHQSFTPADFDAQYNLRLGRPDLEETVIPSWNENSQIARETLNATLDIRYGEGEKQKCDIFRCADAAAPTLIFFHGGYWQRGDKSIYSFLATPFVKAGVNVVAVGYDLCPTVSITQISQEAREAIAFIWRNAETLGINRQKITVMGHSAGGHITEMMMATDWSAYGADLPVGLIQSGIPISPISYLEPVRLSPALNASIRMDAEEAQTQSPMIAHPPHTNAPQMLVVGGAETDEFHRQAQMYVDAFHTNERDVSLYIVPSVDHFDELNVLVDDNSPLFSKTLAMLSSGS